MKGSVVDITKKIHSKKKGRRRMTKWSWGSTRGRWRGIFITRNVWKSSSAAWRTMTCPWRTWKKSKTPSTTMSKATTSSLSLSFSLFLFCFSHRGYSHAFRRRSFWRTRESTIALTSTSMRRMKAPMTPTVSSVLHDPSLPLHRSRYPLSHLLRLPLRHHLPVFPREKPLR